MATLTRMLAGAAEARPDARFVAFVERGAETDALTYEQTWAAACRWAAALEANGVGRGDRLVLALPNSASFVGAFFGALLTGAIPAAVPPLSVAGPDHPAVQTLVERIAFLDARALVAPESACCDAGALPLPSRGHLAVVTRSDLPGQAPERSPDSAPDEVAFLQFTSGTAGNSKAVQLTHSAVMAQLEGISHALALDPEADSAVSWLPLFHDMGLIGFLLTPAFVRRHVTLLRSEEFAVRPGLWVQALSATRATITGGPPSAYALCARRVRAAEAADLDLSQLRVALVGAEQVTAAGLERFIERFAPCGLRPTSILPTYGLAENGLAVTIPRLGVGPRFDVLDLERLEKHGVASAPTDGTARSRAIASVGRPLPGLQVAVLDDHGRPLGSERVGEVAVSGPTVMAGYLKRPEASRAALREGWLHTGDLGYLKGGDLHITGRRKEILIVGGCNYCPEDLEAVAAGVEGVRANRVVAISVAETHSATEAVVLLAETGISSADGRGRIDREIRASLARAGLPVDRVVLLPPRSLRTTASGKLMRLDARTRFLEGRFPPETGGS